MAHASLRQTFRRIGKFATTKKKQHGAKASGARSRVCILLKLARRKCRSPKQTSANPQPPSQNPQESAAGFLIRASLIYAVFSVRVIFLRFPHVVRAKPSLYRPAV